MVNLRVIRRFGRNEREIDNFLEFSNLSRKIELFNLIELIAKIIPIKFVYKFNT